MDKKIYGAILGAVAASSLVAGVALKSAVSPAPSITAACPCTTTSASGAVSPPAASVVDANCVAWTVVKAQVAKNGVVDTTSGWVAYVLWYKGVIYQVNTGNQFYSWNGTAWAGPLTDPRTSTPPSTGNIPLGIQNDQLVWSSTATIDSIYQAMGKDLPGLKWVRADIQDDDAGLAANYVEELKQIHAIGAKALVMSSPTSGDVGGGSFPYPLSKADPAKVAKRFTTYINAAKAAGQTIEAFEIGNELDTTGFNSDSPANVALFVQSYGSFLNAAIGAIRAGMPSAKIVTVGFANEMSYDPGGHLANPPAALAQLKNWNGQNLLAKIDGYGMHVYPTPDNIVGWTQAIFAQYQAAGISDKPIWISEWGFHRAAFPYNGQSRAWANQQWLNYVQGYKGLTFAATILFDFHGGDNDYDIFDGNTLRADEAAVINNWNK